MNVSWGKVKNMLLVLHLGFSVVLVYITTPNRLYDRFLSRYTFYIRENIRGVSGRTIIIKHTKVLITEKESKRKEILNKSIKYMKLLNLSHKIHMNYQWKIQNTSNHAEVIENTGNIRLK